MAFVFHIHTSPSCETTHHTTCASVDGGEWDHSCMQIASGRNRGKFGCISRIAACSFRRESGTCPPPCFRTSAGPRVERRNPWQLQCSRNQLRARTPLRRLGRSLSLRPSWLLASWAAQTEPKLSLPQASTSGLPVLKSPRGLPEMTTAPNGELRRQDFHLQVQQLVCCGPSCWANMSRLILSCARSMLERQEDALLKPIPEDCFCASRALGARTRDAGTPAPACRLGTFRTAGNSPQEGR
jgi:hypothetical protein